VCIASPHVSFRGELMDTLLPFIVSGIATGAIYGLAGTGLVLTYKTSGVFNFAHGAVAAAAAYVFYWLHVDHGMHWVPAFLICVFGLGAAFGLALEAMARHLAAQRTTMKVVGTIGIILIVQGLATIKYGPDALRVKQYLPHGKESFRFGGVNVTYDQVIITVVALLAAAGLFAMFKFTRMGLAMRAVVSDPDLVGLHGTDARQVRRVAWLIGSTFATLSGVLVAPLVGIQSLTLTFLVVQAFGSAALGAFSSIPLTFAGGLFLGILSDVSKKYVVDVDWLVGLPSSLPFIFLIIVLLVLPRRMLLPATSVQKRPPLQWRGPFGLRLGTGVVLTAILASIPLFVSLKLPFFTYGLTQGIMLLSLGLLVRTSGQISLAHCSFAAVGAVAFAQFKANFDMPWLLAVLLGALVVVPVGALCAIPAIRLSGLFLALATFGFALMIERLYFPMSIGFTELASGRAMPRPNGFESDERYYYVVLAFLVVTALAMVAIDRARLGRVLRGMSESSTAMSTMGLNTTLSRVIVFCISSFFAGIAGILYGASVHFAVIGDVPYSAFNSLVVLALLALAPFGSPWFAFVGITSAIIPGYVDNAKTTYWMNVLFGVFAIMIALRGGNRTISPGMRDWIDSKRRRKVPRLRDLDVAAVVEGDGAVVIEPHRAGLEAIDLEVRFGGLRAVNGVSLKAPMGQITGLMGPNGAGKTTTFNACSGLNSPQAGRILLHGEDVTHLGSAARGRRGMGRTFQITELCESLTVAENVALGLEAGLAGSNVFTQITARRSEARRTAARAEAALQLCGITHLAEVQAGALSTGQRRLVELARCLAGPFDLLLLDEPSSGLDHEETVRFGEILTGVVRERGCGILLVEHDMSLIMRVCKYIYVLDFGELVFDGTPADVASSPLVQAAYLGSESIEEHVAESRQ
jgi:ABC-type branched-subunit amino acid transport system ATPase component/branched-subunit amino acid ABC-type transport system permease component